MRTTRLSFLIAGFVAVSASIGHAQLRKVVAELTPLIEADGVHAGTTVRAALGVTLPEGYHVQSNAPRDPLLIPTELRLDSPTGVAVVEVVFPKTVDFKLEGNAEPLAVNLEQPHRGSLWNLPRHHRTRVVHFGLAVRPEKRAVDVHRLTVRALHQSKQRGPLCPVRTWALERKP